MPLDTIDLKMLALLQKEGRLSNQQLAKRVALSPSACLRRLHTLEDSGVILGGYQAIVHVSLDQSQPGWHEAFVAHLADWPEVREASIVTGASNYILQVSTADLQAFSGFMVNKLNRVHGVREICSHT